MNPTTPTPAALVGRAPSACRFFDAVFDGHRLTTLTIEGTPYWLAREVGEVLGYGDKGRALIEQISDEWASELMPERHYRKIVNGELAALKAIISDMPGVVRHVIDGRARSVTLLSREGLNRVLILTGKPVGIRFRDWLDADVLPAIQETGGYSVAPEPPKVDATPPPPVIEPTPATMRRAAELRRIGNGLVRTGNRSGAHAVFAAAAELVADRTIPALHKEIPRDPEQLLLPAVPPLTLVPPIAPAPRPDPWVTRVLRFMETQRDPVCGRDILAIVFGASRREKAALEKLPQGSAGVYADAKGRQRRGWVHLERRKSAA